MGQIKDGCTLDWASTWPAPLHSAVGWAEDG